MADRSISELTEATELLDDGLTVVYQAEETKKIAGSALKTYAKQAVVNYAKEAAAIAIEDATTAAEEAQTAKTAAETAQEAAENAQTAAENAQDAAQTAKDAAVQAKSDAVSAKDTAQTAASTATEKATAASEAAEDAAASATQAEEALAAIEVPDITVGNTTTLPAGSNATVTRRTGSPNTAPVFDFGIPKGADGTGTGDMEKSTYDPNNKAEPVAFASDLTTHTGNKANPHEVTAAQVGARPDTWTPSASDVGADATGTAAGLINRTTAVDAADTNYTTLMARGESLHAEETTPTVNGAICWMYE